jgi:DNA-directed RNA polymerase subunit alpha
VPKVTPQADFDSLQKELEQVNADLIRLGTRRHEIVAIFTKARDQLDAVIRKSGAAPFSRKITADSPIEELDLSVRDLNCLRAENIEKVGQLLERSESQILTIPNFGRKALNNLKEVLVSNGLKLKSPT